MPDLKITELTANTAPLSTDLAVIVDDPAGSPSTQKITIQDLVGDNVATNLIRNGNFINNSTNGYGSTPDDWTSSSSNPVQGGFPTMTKQQLIDLLGIADGDIEGLWNLNEASGNATDLSSNGYTLTDRNTVTSSSDGLMASNRFFTIANSEYLDIAGASCPNLEFTGSRTCFAFFKTASAATAWQALISKSNSANTIRNGLMAINSTKNITFIVEGLTTNTSVTSDVQLEDNKWYLAICEYDATNSKLINFINGVEKSVTASGSATSTSNGDFAIGRGNSSSGQYFGGAIALAGVLSIALTSAQRKRLFAATLYRGQKIRRSTTNASLTQSLPEDLVERLRGKTVTLSAKMYQEVASTGTISVDDGTADTSATTTTTGSWVDVSVTSVISSTATAITLKLNHSTSDGNTWFKEIRLNEGSTSLPYSHSQDDWSRFSRALMMEFVDKDRSYRIDGDLAYFAGAITTNELIRDGQFGYDTTNNRLYIREQGIVKYVAMT